MAILLMKQFFGVLSVRLASATGFKPSRPSLDPQIATHCSRKCPKIMSYTLPLLARFNCDINFPCRIVYDMCRFCCKVDSEGNHLSPGAQLSYRQYPTTTQKRADFGHTLEYDLIDPDATIEDVIANAARFPLDSFYPENVNYYTFLQEAARWKCVGRRTNQPTPSNTCWEREK